MEINEFKQQYHDLVEKVKAITTDFQEFILEADEEGRGRVSPRAMFMLESATNLSLCQMMADYMGLDADTRGTFYLRILGGMSEQIAPQTVAQQSQSQPSPQKDSD